MDASASSTPTRKKGFRPAAFILAAVLATEAAYYVSVFSSLPENPPSCDLVMVYSGTDDRINIAKHWDDPKTLFLFSGWDYNRAILEQNLGLAPARLLVEDKSRTTDQNARYCAPMVRSLGAKKIVLALPWYHLPRALFLTRYYLRGSGATVTPYATTPLPAHWWFKLNFYLELMKFWGSLLRIGLSLIGIEHWPPHADFG